MASANRQFTSSHIIDMSVEPSLVYIHLFFSLLYVFRDKTKMSNTLFHSLHKKPLF